MKYGTLFSEIFAFGLVLTSEVAERVGVRLGVTGWGGLADDEAESAPQQRVWGPLGWLARPLPPEGAGEDKEGAEAILMRTADGLEAIAFSDARLHQALNPTGGSKPEEGQFVQVHYGGGLHSLDHTASNTGDQKGTLQSLYVPYEFSGGTPGAAMLIALNPDEKTISIVNGKSDGSSNVFVNVKQDELQVILGPAAFLSLKADQALLHFPKIMLKGVCYLGAQAEAAVPLTPGLLSPPSPSVHVSPV